MSDYTYIRDINKNIFECSVSLEGALKRYILNGCEDSAEIKVDVGKNDKNSKQDDKCNSVADFCSENTIEIDTLKEKFLQLICVRDNDQQRADYQINIKSHSSKRENNTNSSTILLCSHTLGEREYITNERINIEVGKGESLELIVMQNENGFSEHNTFFNIELKEDSWFKLNIITVYGGRVNNKISTLLTERGSTCELNGLYLGSNEQIINTDINLIHRVGGCVSNQLFKGILGDSAKADFKGEVVVEKDAQKTEAYQANNNLLISDQAKAVSKPELIIYADDVKCSHGSTVGTIGNEELFYMRSRGISLQEAKILQQQAFAGAVLEKIGKEELRNRLSQLIERRLRGEATHCQGCSRRCC